MVLGDRYLGNVDSLKYMVWLVSLFTLHSRLC